MCVSVDNIKFIPVASVSAKACRCSWVTLGVLENVVKEKWRCWSSLKVKISVVLSISKVIPSACSYLIGVHVRIRYDAIPPRDVAVGGRLPVTRLHSRSSYNFMLTEIITCAARSVVLKRFTVTQEQ